MEYQYLATVLLSLLFLALFSGLEIAFLSANRLHIELQNKSGTLNGRILSNLINNPSQFIGTTLIGNTASLVIYGIGMAYLLEPFIVDLLPGESGRGSTVLAIQILLSALLVLIAAEYIPKSVFRLNPKAWLSVLAFPFLFIYYLMYPLVWIFVGFSSFFVTKILKLKYGENMSVFKITDLNSFIQNNLEGAGEDSMDIDPEIFENAVEFKTVRIRECMVPRTDIVAVRVDDSIAELNRVFVESGHSKIVVYKETIDEVVGYCHHLELFKKPKSIQDILTPIIIIPESALANELLVKFIAERKSLAVVVDEFGGVGGIVSMEDIIEEIFGEIEDEYDSEQLLEQQLSEEEYLLSARHDVDYLNEKYGWSIPVGDYETLSGFILSLKGTIPKKGETIVHGPFTITVVSKQEHRLESVKIKINSSSLS